MSLDLSDPNILTSYEEVVKTKSKDWLLLSYKQTRDRLWLINSGNGGVETMRVDIMRNVNDIFFGFCREQENGKNYYAIIAYVPESVSGVRRARALVHSRAVAGLLKHHHATINVNKVEQLTSNMIRERLHLGPTYIPRTSSKVHRSVSEPISQIFTNSPLDNKPGTGVVAESTSQTIINTFSPPPQQPAPRALSVQKRSVSGPAPERFQSTRTPEPMSDSQRSTPDLVPDLTDRRSGADQTTSLGQPTRVPGSSSTPRKTYGMPELDMDFIPTRSPPKPPTSRLPSANPSVESLSRRARPEPLAELSSQDAVLTRDPPVSAPDSAPVSDRSLRDSSTIASIQPSPRTATSESSNTVAAVSRQASPRKATPASPQTSEPSSPVSPKPDRSAFDFSRIRSFSPDFFLSPFTLPKSPEVKKKFVPPVPVHNLPEWDEEEAPPTPPKDIPIPVPRSPASRRTRSEDVRQPPPLAHHRALSQVRAEPRVIHHVGHPPDTSKDLPKLGCSSLKPTVTLLSTHQLEKKGSESSPVQTSPVSIPSSRAKTTPAERARVRAELARQREEEARREALEEEERRARIKYEKEEAARVAEEEEERRKLMVMEEKRRAAYERERRELQRMQEEEHQRRELELKKQADKERRRKEARRLEEARAEEQRRVEELVREREKQKQEWEAERRARMKQIASEIRVKEEIDGPLHCGWVTVQTSSSISWKRRFFELTTDSLLLYKDATDRTEPLDWMDLSDGRVKDIKDPNDSYCELHAIANSFAVEFYGDGPWLLFSDTCGEKDVLMSLLIEVSGLDD